MSCVQFYWTVGLLLLVESIQPCRWPGPTECKFIAPTRSCVIALEIVSGFRYSVMSPFQTTSFMILKNCNRDDRFAFVFVKSLRCITQYFSLINTWYALVKWLNPELIHDATSIDWLSNYTSIAFVYGFPVFLRNYLFSRPCTMLMYHYLLCLAYWMSDLS